MNFTLEQRTQILKLTLEGLTDKEIAKQLKPRLRSTQLVYSRTHGVLPKRKAINTRVIVPNCCTMVF